MKSSSYLTRIVAGILGVLLFSMPPVIIAANRPGDTRPPKSPQMLPARPPQATPFAAPQGPPPKEGPRFLTGPNSGRPQDIALAYIRQHSGRLGLVASDLADMVVKYQYESRHNQVTHLYLRQRIDGIEVYNGDININIDRQGRIINLGNRFVSNVARAVQSRSATLTAPEAVEQAAHALNLTLIEPLLIQQQKGGPANEMVLSTGGISVDEIPVKLMYLPLKRDQVRLVWDMVIRLKDGLHWWHMRVDARTGEVLSQNDWMAQDAYQVYGLPNRSPVDGPRTLVVNPADTLASPFGWHDTNGQPGPEFSDTRGNNVFAQEDSNADDKGGFRPDGGPGLVFSTTLDLKMHPSHYLTSSIVNLFYWNNILHDIHYQYGFDEVSGNFQQHNYGRGGLAGDPVQADVHDGAGRNNANFGTPPDAFDPRMQMFLWTLIPLARDSALDSEVIIHEYGHGVSNRLTGGPHNVDCLSTQEQMGEGWSDLHSLFLTALASDTRTTARGVGTYLLGQAPDGPGIRNYPYSTDLAVNPLTYADLNTAWTEHQVGEIWAAMVWEVYWNLVDEYGFDGDFYRGQGGNNLTMQLVMDGLKLQPCNPTFVEARDAILLADQINQGGTNQCHIWQGFAKRGLGLSSQAGSSNSTLDGTAAFDIPLSCLDTVVMTKQADPPFIAPGHVLTYTITAGNYTNLTLTQVVITDPIPLNTTYLSGTVQAQNGLLRWEVPVLSPDSTVTQTFQVRVDSEFPEPVIVFEDDLENGFQNWTVTHTIGIDDWKPVSDNPHSGSWAWFAPDPDRRSDQALLLTDPITLAAGTILSFWHTYDTEFSYDGGLLEISTDDGKNWADLGELMINNGYNGTISLDYFTSRPAFSGNSQGYLQTKVDLSSYAGLPVRLRFRFLSDRYVGGEGWYIDDIKLIEQAEVQNTAFLTSAQGETSQATSNTPLVRPAQLIYWPTEITTTLFLGQTQEFSLTLANTGDRPLLFRLPLVKEQPTCELFDHSNGDFERGDFNGWQTVDDNGTWLLNDGTYPRLVDQATTPPLMGHFSALVDQLGVGTNILYREFDLPVYLPGAVTVSWIDQWENHAARFDLYQSFRVLLLGPGGSPVLGELFTTQSGDQPVAGPTWREVDITELIKPYAGQQVRLQFEVQADLFRFNVQVDEVALCEAKSIWASTIPRSGQIPPQSETTVAVLLKTGHLTQTGDYQSTLEFQGNMAIPVPGLPLRMHLTPAKSVFLPLIMRTQPTIFFDDVENGAEHWVATGLWHVVQDQEACGNSHSPTTSWYYGHPTRCTYDTETANKGQLTTRDPIPLPDTTSKPSLTFWSWEATEGLNSYDRRQVLISTDGISFEPIWASTNNESEWYEVNLDLSAYAGQRIWLRFSFDTNDNISNGFAGWYVDDIGIALLN